MGALGGLEVHSDELRTSIGRVPLLKQEEQSRQAAVPPSSLAVRRGSSVFFTVTLFNLHASVQHVMFRLRKRTPRIYLVVKYLYGSVTIRKDMYNTY